MASMYDIPEVYQHPNDPLRPVICIDEANKQLIKEKRIQCESRCSEKVDLIYVRNGALDVFMISELLASRRETVVTEIQTAQNFVKILKYISDVLYSKTEKIILVTDNLNIYIQQPHYINLSWKNTDWQNDLCGVIRQNMEVGLIWQK